MSIHVGKMSPVEVTYLNYKNLEKYKEYKCLFFI